MRRYASLPSRWTAQLFYPVRPFGHNQRFLAGLRNFSSACSMASDDDYMSFLNKANADLDAGRRQPAVSSSVPRLKAVDADEQIPAPLATIKTLYVSETDEPFEPVVLRWTASTGAWPDHAQLSTLLTGSADLAESITTLTPESFDPRGEYQNVVLAVRSAAKEDEVRIYRVEMGSRVEYYLLGLEREAQRIVGLRTLAIET